MVSCENRYSGGKKHGQWTEYLDSTYSKEVPKDSSYFKRVLTYNEGYPEGMVIDYYSKSDKIHSKKYIKSGPYSNYVNRPKEKLFGLYVQLDSLDQKVIKFQYYDEFGDFNLKKFYTTGIDEISNDEHFDASFYLNHLDENSNEFESFKKFKNNPDLYDEEVFKLISIHSSDSFLKGFFSTINTGPIKWSDVLVMDYFSHNGIMGKDMEDLAKKILQKSTTNNEVINTPFETCRWCGQRIYENHSGFCSLKCGVEAGYWKKNQDY
jgi:hypothetical protein